MAFRTGKDADFADISVCTADFAGVIGAADDAGITLTFFHRIAKPFASQVIWGNTAHLRRIIRTFCRKQAFAFFSGFIISELGAGRAFDFGRVVWASGIDPAFAVVFVDGISHIGASFAFDEISIFGTSAVDSSYFFAFFGSHVITFSFAGNTIDTILVMSTGQNGPSSFSRTFGDGFVKYEQRAPILIQGATVTPFPICRTISRGSRTFNTVIRGYRICGTG